MQTKSFLVDPANWPEVKECLIREAAVIGIGALHLFLKVLSKIVKDKEDLNFIAKFGFQKIKTKTHHIRVFFDDKHIEPLIIVRPRGFLKLWQAMERMDMSSFIADEVFDPACPPEVRGRVLGKIIGMKAFW